MSELFDKQVNAHKKELYQGSHKLLQGCAMKMKAEKMTAPKIFFDGRKEFIRHVQNTHIMDIK